LISKRGDSGAISMKGYNVRIEQIDKIAGEMLEFQEKRNLKEKQKVGIL